MTSINDTLIPKSTRNVSSIEGETGGGARQSSHYGFLGLDGKETDFTMSDFISLGVLWARALDKDDPKAEFYEYAFLSLKKAFGVSDVSEFLDILGIEKRKEKENPKGRDDMFRQSGIVRFLWFRAMMIEVQDPYWRVLEGDIWGLSSYKSEAERKKSVRDGFDFYNHIVKEFTNGLPRLDKAICAHFGWKYKGKISLSKLKKEFNFPDPDPYFEDDF